MSKMILLAPSQPRPGNASLTSKDGDVLIEALKGCIGAQRRCRRGDE
jgi:hypothetical protein